MIGRLLFPPPRGTGTRREDPPHHVAQILLALRDIPWISFPRLTQAQRHRVRDAARAVWRFLRGDAIGIKTYLLAIAAAWGRGPSPFEFIPAGRSFGDIDHMIAMAPDHRVTRTAAKRVRDA